MYVPAKISNATAIFCSGVKLNALTASVRNVSPKAEATPRKKSLNLCFLLPNLGLSYPIVYRG